MNELKAMFTELTKIELKDGLEKLKSSKQFRKTYKMKDPDLDQPLTNKEIVEFINSQEMLFFEQTLDTLFSERLELSEDYKQSIVDMHTEVRKIARYCPNEGYFYT